MGITGSCIYTLLMQQKRAALSSKTIRKVSLLVFSSTIILIIIMGSILTYLVLGTNYVLFNTIYSGVTGIAFVIFTLINGIGFSWETRESESGTITIFRKLSSVVSLTHISSSFSSTTSQ